MRVTKAILIAAASLLILTLHGCGADSSVKAKNDKQEKPKEDLSTKNLNQKGLNKTVDSNRTGGSPTGSERSPSNITVPIGARAPTGFVNPTRNDDRPNPSPQIPKKPTQPPNADQLISASCMSFCKTSDRCMASGSKSHCKWDMKEPNCYGLYWKNSEKKEVCYHSKNNTSCPEDLPVKCGVLKPVFPGNLIETVNFLHLNNSCSGLCRLVNGCHTSECTDSDSGAYCEGLFWTREDGLKSQSVVHSSRHPDMQLRQRVPCGVYNYTS